MYSEQRKFDMLKNKILKNQATKLNGLCFYLKRLNSKACNKFERLKSYKTALYL